MFIYKYHSIVIDMEEDMEEKEKIRKLVKIIFDKYIAKSLANKSMLAVSCKIIFDKYITKSLANKSMSAVSCFPLYKRAIVVLSGPNQDKRLEKGLSEYKKDPSAVLVISGFGKNSDEKNEYVAKGRGLDSILIENGSTNTEENAINSIYEIKRSFPNVERITVVSDYVHQPRSETLFKRYSSYNYDIDFSGVKTEDKLHRVIYELCAFPLSMMPYDVHKKLTSKIRNALYRDKE